MSSLQDRQYVQPENPLHPSDSLIPYRWIERLAHVVLEQGNPCADCGSTSFCVCRGLRLRFVRHVYRLALLVHEAKEWATMSGRVGLEGDDELGLDDLQQIEDLLQAIAKSWMEGNAPLPWRDEVDYLVFCRQIIVRVDFGPLVYEVWDALQGLGMDGGDTVVDVTALAVTFRERLD